MYGGTVMAFYSYQHLQLTCHLHVHTLCADLTTCKLLAAQHSQIIHSTNHIRAGGPGDNSIPQQMVICQNCANTLINASVLITTTMDFFLNFLNAMTISGIEKNTQQQKVSEQLCKTYKTRYIDVQTNHNIQGRGGREFLCSLGRGLK